MNGITKSDDVMAGQAVFVGTRVPVLALVEHLRSGDGLAGFLREFPSVTKEAAVAVMISALEQVSEGAVSALPKPRHDTNGIILNAHELTAAQVANKAVRCPACEKMNFKMWPEGWDAHAEHKCAGLAEVDGTARKAEYKRRYGHLFR